MGLAVSCVVERGVLMGELGGMCGAVWFLSASLMVSAAVARKGGRALIGSFVNGLLGLTSLLGGDV